MTIAPRRRIAKPFLALAVVVGLGLSASACTKEEIARFAIYKQFKGSRFAVALMIATCESRLQADAVSPGGRNIGLFQINKVHAGWIRRDLGYTWSQLKDPNKNARVARWIYNRAGGWSPWHGACGGVLGI